MAGRYLLCMRDDRYKGTSLPRPVRKLCRMAEREADRAHPERLLKQAVVAFVSDANREISQEFHRRLREHDSAPSLFGASDLAKSARTGLESDIARSIEAGQRVDPTDALRDALRRRGESYSREQKCRLIADRHPDASIASRSVKKACDEGAVIAAKRIMDGQRVPQINDRVSLNEDLLGRPGSEANL